MGINLFENEEDSFDGLREYLIIIHYRKSWAGCFNFFKLPIFHTGNFNC